LTDRAIRAALDAGGVNIRNQFFEYLDLGRNPGDEHMKLMVETMRQRYGQRKIDLVVTLYPEALQFALNEGSGIFHETPILALYLPIGLQPPKTAYWVIPQRITPDVTGTVETGLKLAPGTKRIYVVSGAHPLDRSLEDMARRDLSHLEARLEFRYLSNLPMEEILATVSKASSESIVLLMGVLTDVTGKNFTTREVARKVSQSSCAPVFGLYDVAMGYGIVGGSLISFEHIGTAAGELALEILRGPKEKIPDVMNTPALPMFDWRELRRWNLDESALPKGSIVINREWTLWDYKYYMLGILALGVIQWLLIAGLFAQRRRMAKADESLKERLRFERLSADMSARVLNVAPDEIDQEVEGALKGMVDFFRVSHTILIKGFPGEGRAEITHAAHADDVPPTPIRGNLAAAVPWTSHRMAEGKALCVAALEELPEEATADREFYRNLGVGSFLILPIIIQNSPKYAIGISSHRENLGWSEGYIQRLEAFGKVLANILERKQAEGSLRKSEAKYRHLHETMMDGFVVVDMEGMIKEYNQIYLEMTGYTPEELLRLTYRDLTPEKWHDFEQKIIQEQVLDRGYSDIYEKEYRRKDGTIFPVELRTVLLKDEAGGNSGTWAIIRDITTQKASEMETSATRRKLQQSDRLLRMGELTASLAHELNQPLTAIASNARAAMHSLEKDSFDVGELKEILGDISNDNKRAAEIIRSLRSMFRQGEVERESIAINLLLREVVALFKSAAVIKSVDLQLELAELLPPVHVNKTQIQQVAINLLMNAAEAIPDGSAERRITIRTTPSDHGHVQVAVCDTGSGIAEGETTKVFEPFFSKKRLGMGMGLSICRTIIHAHGGHIWAKNNLDKGATFFFDLPVSD
jgi:PAS domain S-box-containing protein